MNKDTFEGQWQEIKGKIRQQWGKLTDDEIAQIKGRKEELLGKLQAKYGWNKEKAEQEFTTWWNKFSSALKEKSGNFAHSGQPMGSSNPSKQQNPSRPSNPSTPEQQSGGGWDKRKQH